MNSNYQEHPAILKAREILTAMSISTNNTASKIIETNVICLSLDRSTVDLDICHEFEQRKKRRRHSNCQDVVDQLDKCFYCNNPYILNVCHNSHTSLSEEPFRCEIELQFIRAVIWLKSKIQTMRMVSRNDIQQLFKFSTVNQNNVSLICDNINNSNTVEEKRYLIPDYEEGSSCMSSVMSFGEISYCEDNIENKLQNIEDSGIALAETNHEQINDTRISENNKINALQCIRTYSKENQIQIKDGHITKRLKCFDDKISTTSMSILMEDLHVNNFVVGEMRIILKLLEQHEMTQNYVRNRSMINAVDAVNTMIQFLNQLVKEDDISTSAVYLQLSINDIMTTVRKIFNSKSNVNINGVLRQKQLKIILEFCNCLKICEMIIDFLINSLTELIEMMNENQEDPDNQQMIDDIEGHLLCRSLEIAISKYCKIVSPSRNINENSHYYTTYLWRTFWKHSAQYATPMLRSKELEAQWIDELEKLIDLKSLERISIFGNYNAIERAIKMLSTAPMEQM